MSWEGITRNTNTNSLNSTTHMQNTPDPSTRTDANDLDLDAAASAVVLPITTRLDVRSFLKGQHLHAVMLDMVALDAQGASEAELMSYGLALVDLAKTLTSQHTPDDRTLARQQLDADLADDHLRGVIAIDGESPVVLDQFANALEKTAAINVTTARRARSRARQIRTTRSQARQRVGLNGAA